MYMKPAIILFLFTLEHCVEHVYSGQNIHVRVLTWLHEKFKQYVIYLRKIV